MVWIVLNGLASPTLAINYVYDDNGRLVAVIDPTSTDPLGGTAIYDYDAAGNIVAIRRQLAALVSVLSIAPSCRPVGTPITIYGTGFSAMPNNNTVTFANGVTATPTAASSMELSINVPPGAGPGPIRVTANGITSAPSSQSFTLGCSAPTITNLALQDLVWVEP